MTDTYNNGPDQASAAEGAEGASLTQHVAVLLPHWKAIAASAMLSGLIGLGLSFIIPPTFTARTSFLSPQTQQNSAASALASLGALTGLAGAAAGIKNPADQYIALLLSERISNRIIERFDLVTVYDSKFKVDARRELAKNVRVGAGKKDNMLAVEVDDDDPKRAAEMANAYVQELKALTNGLAMTEAQQRRAFFEQQLAQSRDKLSRAQIALQKSGINPGLMKSEPKAAAEAYSRLKADIAGTEIRLISMKGRLADGAPEIRQIESTLAAQKSQLAKLEKPLENVGSEDYVSAYREFKYQEALFDIFSRQFEVAKVDESREGTLIQVIDEASPPERKSKPKRLFIAAGGAGLGLVLSCFWLWRRQMRRGAASLTR